MKKYMVLISSILIMICLGGVYAWSIFVPPLMAEYALSTAQTQLVFGFTIAFFTMGMVLAGQMEKEKGPRKTAFVSALLFAMGYLYAGASEGNFLMIFLGIGVLSGMGIGFGYVCALTTPIKWFPQKKGLITGLSVAGFGGGAILLSVIVKWLLENNIAVLDIFRNIGLGYGMLVFLGALFLSTPGAAINQKPIEQNFQLKGLWRNIQFWSLSIGMFAGTFAGLLIIGNLKPIGLSYGATENAATAAIGLLAIGNMAGRVLWGYISDKLGGRFSIVAALVFLAFACMSLLIGARYEMVFMMISVAIGIGFGANFVLFAAETAHEYGIEKLGIIYPYIFLFYGLAGIVGPPSGGLLYDMMKNYNTAIIVSAVICLGGAAAYAYLSSMNHKLKPNES